MLSLETQASERKDRLQKLKNLKRKPKNDDEGDGDIGMTSPDGGDLHNEAENIPSSTGSVTLSGRNYDPETRAPRLGFDSNPSADRDTLEQRAAEIAQQAKDANIEEEKVDKPVDLFSLQPKAPNWDLKRDVDKKLERLEARTNSAIAKLVRDRIMSAKTNEKSAGVDADAPSNLAEIVRQRQREDEMEDGRDNED